MVTVNEVFKNKSPDFVKLINYGFHNIGDKYVYSVMLSNTELKMEVTVQKNGELCAEIFDTAYNNEKYTLHLIEDINGGFIGQVRAEFIRILEDIAEKCFNYDVFKSNITAQVLNYVKEKYGVEPEYPWNDDNAVLRREDNGKWFGAILKVNAKKLGLKNDEIVEIIDLKIESQVLAQLVDNKNYFRGYHMNKKHWLTLVLDGRVSVDEICGFIDESYRLSGKK